jgi:filamentous hemagglutinin family protein
MSIPAWPVNSLLVLGSILTVAWPGSAQIISDGTTGSQVESIGPNFTITQGTRSGGNLFHSFSEFSIPTGGSARFDNAIDVTNIFSRVTGPNISNLDGLLRANGSANLFLLNPQGILFGPNARLNIGGSFLATTAQAVRFADGSEFSAINPARLLTVNLPIGLQFGSSASPIENRSSGGLSVIGGKTLAFLGGSLIFNGGKLIAPGGNLELGSVGADSFVNLGPTLQGWTLGYGSAKDFQDITLRQRASVDATGLGGGNIQVQGRQISLQDASTLVAGTFGPIPGGDIIVRATESIDLRNTFTPNPLDRGISTYSSSGATGSAGNVWLEAPRLYIENGLVATGTLGSGNAGNITIRSSELTINHTITGSRFSLTNSPEVSGLFTTVLFGATGQGGNVQITSDRISLQNSGSIASGTFGLGTSGNIRIQANQLEARGGNANNFTPSGLSTSAFPLSMGNAGNIELDVNQLRLLDGASISSTTSGRGDAGDIDIQARSVEIGGVASFRSLQQGELIQSGISAAAFPVALPTNIPNPFINPNIPMIFGAAGSITLETDRLLVRDQGLISVSNLTNSDNAGGLTIRAQDLRLTGGGTLEAIVRSGSQGNINLTSDILLLRQGSKISTNALDNATGGNISLTTKSLVASENSDITANAKTSFGGRVFVNAEAIFGTTFRPQLTLESDITASSDRGAEFSGAVSISTPTVSPTQGLTVLPVDLINPNQQVASQCNTNQGSSFVVTGRGGVPNEPSQKIDIDRTWSDLRSIEPAASRATRLDSSNATLAVQPLRQATHWQQNTNGSVELLAANPSPITQSTQVTCADVRKP